MMLKINQRFYYDGIWINKIHKKFFVIIVDILMANSPNTLINNLDEQSASFVDQTNNSMFGTHIDRS